MVDIKEDVAVFMEVLAKTFEEHDRSISSLSKARAAKPSQPSLIRFCGRPILAPRLPPFNGNGLPCASQNKEKDDVANRATATTPGSGQPPRSPRHRFSQAAATTPIAPTPPLEQHPALQLKINPYKNSGHKRHQPGQQQLIPKPFDGVRSKRRTDGCTYNMSSEAAAVVITAAAKGFLVRKLLQTNKAQNCKRAIHDTQHLLLEFAKEGNENLSYSDIVFIKRTKAQLNSAREELRGIFNQFSGAERAALLKKHAAAIAEKEFRQLEVPERFVDTRSD